MPGQGHTRRELTSRSVLFFPLYSFLVVYQPDVRPIRIMAVLRGKRDLKEVRRSQITTAGNLAGKVTQQVRLNRRHFLPKATDPAAGVKQASNARVAWEPRA